MYSTCTCTWRNFLNYIYNAYLCKWHKHLHVDKIIYMYNYIYTWNPWESNYRDGPIDHNRYKYNYNYNQLLSQVIIEKVFQPSQKWWQHIIRIHVCTVHVHVCIVHVHVCIVHVHECCNHKIQIQLIIFVHGLYNIYTNSKVSSEQMKQ